MDLTVCSILWFSVRIWSTWVAGAVPPWLQDDPLEGSSGTAAQPQIGPSLQDFLKQSKTSHIYLIHSSNLMFWLISGIL